MTLKQYFPISVAFFAAVVVSVYRLGIPVVPIASILLVGETLLGFQLEDHRVPRLLKYLFSAPQSGNRKRDRWPV